MRSCERGIIILSPGTLRMANPIPLHSQSRNSSSVLVLTPKTNSPCPPSRTSSTSSPTLDLDLVLALQPPKGHHRSRFELERPSIPAPQITPSCSAPGIRSLLSVIGSCLADPFFSEKTGNLNCLTRTVHRQFFGPQNLLTHQTHLRIAPHPTHSPTA
jgi:hypothetical protein